jgi:uncharacterized repeat protein (TIGR01451 family)
MMRTCAASFLLGLAVTTASAQVPPALPSCGPAPLLFVRFVGPQGMQASFYQGHARNRTLPAPAVVGIRPGYLYRVKLTGMATHPGLSLYPTLEVRGSLYLAHLGPSKFPAPVVLTERDIDNILAGSMVTKLIYLEHPDRALPSSYPADDPFELDLPPGSKLLEEAWARGRPVLIVRLGGRLLVSEEELAHSSAFGTILYPGEHSLPLPQHPPCVPIDSRLGLRPPEEECLHDGGDQGIRAGFDLTGQLGGVEPEDTVAEYTDSSGRRRVTCSNRVCLCVPRFAVLRCIVPLETAEAILPLENAREVRAQELVRSRQPSGLALQYEQLKGLQGRQRVSNNIQAVGPGTLIRMEVLNAEQLNLGPLVILELPRLQMLAQVQWTELKQQVEWAREMNGLMGLQEHEQAVGAAVIGRVQGGPEVVKAYAETRDLTVCCCETPCPPDLPLVLVKCANRKAAQVDEVVTFTLRYSNHGGRPIDDVAVVDSLATRLEYVPGSAVSDRNAVFTLQENEAGSTLLRWEITGRLLPGQSGVVRFQARVR